MKGSVGQATLVLYYKAVWRHEELRVPKGLRKECGVVVGLHAVKVPLNFPGTETEAENR